jgi:hypothetical protein
VFLSVEILHSLKVKERVSGFLVVLSVLQSQILEVSSSPFGYSNSSDDVNDYTANTYDKENNGIKHKDDNKHEYQFDEYRHKVEQHKSEDLCERLRAS